MMMTTWRTLGGFVLAAGTAVFAIWLWRGSPDLLNNRVPETTATDSAAVPAIPIHGPTLPRLAALEDQLRQVTDQLRHLTQSYSELSQTQRETAQALEALAAHMETGALISKDDSSSAQGPQAGLEHNPEKEEAEFQEEQRQAMATLTDQLSSEGLDVAWSVQAMDQITQISETLEHDGSTLSYVDCRATLCKLEVNHRDRDALDRFTQGLPMALKWNSTMTLHVVDHADGSKTSTVFVSRDGYDLDY